MRACIFPNRMARQIATEKTKASEKKPAPQNSAPTSSCGAPVGWWKDERRTSLLAEMSIVGRQFFREARRPLPVPYSLYWYQLFHEARGAAVDSEEGGSHFSRVFFFLPLFVRRWVLSVGLFYFIVLFVFVDFVVSFFSPSLFLFFLLGVGRWALGYLNFSLLLLFLKFPSFFPSSFVLFFFCVFCLTHGLCPV